MPEEKVYDIGQNAKETGLFFIFARYIFPFLFAFMIGMLGIVFVAYLLREFLEFAIMNPIRFIPTAPGLPAV